MMASEDCVLSFRTSGPSYRTKQMASGDARDLSVTSQQIGTQSLKGSHPFGGDIGQEAVRTMPDWHRHRSVDVAVDSGTMEH